MVAPVKVGRARKKALDILWRLGPARPIEFAKEMWPRARAWGRPHIMNWSARCYLARLVEAKLVSETEFGFMLNVKGLDLHDELSPLDP